MKNYEKILSTVELFRNIAPDQLNTALTCLSTVTAEYKKSEILLMTGDKPESVGIVLEGTVHIVKEDYDGGRTILAALEPGDIFAEALCCAGVSESPVTVIAEADSTVMLLAFTRILHTCPNACDHHQTLIENMLRILAHKNLFLQRRIELARMKSIRAKVLGYLESLDAQKGRSITLPLGREAMADYLCVERSALSHELMKMKKDGLLEYNKYKFTLL